MISQSPIVEDIQNYAQNIVDTVREPLLILDATLRVRSANRAFYQTFHVSSQETECRLIYELFRRSTLRFDHRLLSVTPSASILTTTPSASILARPATDDCSLPIIDL